MSEAADGTQGIRRQRLSGISEVSIPTSLKVVKIYEELNRVLSGRVDFNTFISKVAESFRQKLLNDVYSLWSTATADDFGGVTYFPTAGAYDEEELLDLIAQPWLLRQVLRYSGCRDSAAPQDWFYRVYARR